MFVREKASDEASADGSNRLASSSLLQSLRELVRVPEGVGDRSRLLTDKRAFRSAQFAVNLLRTLLECRVE